MSVEQLTLSYERPTPDRADERALISFLGGRGWMTAAQICAATRWTDRAVREIASGSDQVISYPGSPGYKLLGDCTAEEYHRYRLARRNQAREMVGKVIRTDRIYYARPPVR
jgi:hypothetical protein